MTLQDILTYAELKGYESQRHLVDASSFYTEEIVGFKVTGQHVWHWFKQTTFVATQTREARVFLSFDHSYSQNTGRTKRGLMHRLRMESKIREALATVTA